MDRAEDLLVRLLELFSDPPLPLILRRRVGPMCRLTIVEALLRLQFSIDSGNRVSEILLLIGVGAGVLQADKPFPDAARGKLSEIEVKLLVFQEL